MAKWFLFLLLLVVGLSACRKTSTTDALQGRWLKKGGGLPADTLRFFVKAGKKTMAFQFSTTGGANWPKDVETEYKLENGLLSLKDTAGGGNEFVPVQSFEWIVPDKEFRVKLYQLVRYISADYTVTYNKLD